MLLVTDYELDEAIIEITRTFIFSAVRGLSVLMLSGNHFIVNIKSAFSIITILAVLCTFSTGCKNGREKHHALNVVGSTSIQPFAELLAQEYMKIHPDREVEVQGGGSTAGLQAASDGLADIGMCSRNLKDNEVSQFEQVQIARDGLALVINLKNPVSGLTIEQIQGLFSGAISNWDQVGGNNEEVWMITREEGSGTRESFVKLVMGEVKISKKALTQESNGAVKELVKGDTAAIGYMSLGLVGDVIKSVPIAGIAPTRDNVVNGSYKLVRPFLFVTKGKPSPDAQQFIDYVLSDEGQSILENEGLVRFK
jgi:phosphate transport system substrate-binding protein